MAERRAACPSAAHAFARYRLPVALSLAALCLLGIYAFGRLPMDFLPSLEAPRLHVRVSVPGLTPTVIEDKVMRPLEGALLGTPGVVTVESVARPGSVTMDLHLKYFGDADAAQQEVTARLEHLKTMLPAAVAPPVMSRSDASLIAAELIVTSGDRDQSALRDWVDGELVKRLRELSGVATVEAQGGVVRDIMVLPDQRRLAGFGIGFGDVIQALQKGREPEARIAMPPVKHRHGRVVMQSGNVAAVAAMPVMLPGGESIPLSEVADVTLGQETSKERVAFNGAEAVKLTVQKQPRAVRADIAERVRAEVDWMRANRLIPAGIEVHIRTRQLDQARRTLERLVESLVGGTLLALLVAYFVSGSGRRTRILGAVMFTTTLTAFAAMLLAGLSLNVMTLGALALASGLLGACAILMFERTTSARHGAVPENPVAAAVALAVALASFAFASGKTAALFSGFVLVFSGAWLISALLARAVVPAFDVAHRRVRPWTMSATRAMQSARRVYGRLLGVLLRRPYTLPVLALLFVGAMAVVFSVRPPETLPAFNPVPGAAMGWRLRGPDGARLAALGDDLVQRLGASPQLREVRNLARVTQDEFVLHADAARAGELGLDITDIGRALAIALTGVSAGSISDADHRYDIRLQLPPRESADAVARGRILLLGEINDRPAAYLRDVATVEQAAMPAEIRHKDGLPEIRVTAVSAPNAAPRQVAAAVRQALRGYTLPADYELSGDGVGDSTDHNGQGMLPPGLALAFLFVALLLWRRSWRTALLVTFCAVTVSAAVTALLVNMPLPFGVWFGAVFAIGIAAFYATAFVTPIEALRQAGTLSRQTLARTAKGLLRPLLTMTLMAIAGMMPLASLGSTVAVLRPVIIIVTASLILAFLASAAFIPPLYFLLSRREQSRAHAHL